MHNLVGFGNHSEQRIIWRKATLFHSFRQEDVSKLPVAADVGRRLLGRYEELAEE